MNIRLPVIVCRKKTMIESVSKALEVSWVKTKYGNELRESDTIINVPPKPIYLGTWHDYIDAFEVFNTYFNIQLSHQSKCMKIIQIFIFLL